MKYRKKPIVVKAIKYTGSNIAEIGEFTGAYEVKYVQGNLYIKTLEGTMRANRGDYIIKGVKGEVYPCKPDIFHETYEKVDD